jgi:hypothetical protein
LSFSILKIA